jgi:hypothetical protein
MILSVPHYILATSSRSKAAGITQIPNTIANPSVPRVFGAKLLHSTGTVGALDDALPSSDDDDDPDGAAPLFGEEAERKIVLEP